MLLEILLLLFSFCKHYVLFGGKCQHSALLRFPSSLVQHLFDGIFNHYCISCIPRCVKHSPTLFNTLCEDRFDKVWLFQYMELCFYLVELSFCLLKDSSDVISNVLIDSGMHQHSEYLTAQNALSLWTKHIHLVYVLGQAKHILWWNVYF